MVDFKVKGKDMITKTAIKSGTGAIIYVPKSWLGKKVVAILEGE